MCPTRHRKPASGRPNERRGLHPLAHLHPARHARGRHRHDPQLSELLERTCADVLRVASTAALVACVVTGHLALWQLLVVGAVNVCAAVFSEIAHSVALRHVVAAAQLPAAFALNDGRGHAISLAGQPVGGFLYGVAPSLPLGPEAGVPALARRRQKAVDPLGPGLRCAPANRRPGNVALSRAGRRCSFDGKVSAAAATRSSHCRKPRILSSPMCR